MKLNRKQIKMLQAICDLQDAADRLQLGLSERVVQFLSGDLAKVFWGLPKNWETDDQAGHSVDASGAASSDAGVLEAG